MRVNKLPNLVAALASVMMNEEDYIFVRHGLEKGEGVKAHKEKVDEWVFISEGEFVLIFGNEKAGRHIELVQKLAGTEVMVLYIPKGEMHALRARSAITYLVLKTKQ
jgi:hypothetical protein